MYATMQYKSYAGLKTVTTLLWQTNLSVKLKVLHNSCKYEKPSLFFYLLTHLLKKTLPFSSF